MAIGGNFDSPTTSKHRTRTVWGLGAGCPTVQPSVTWTGLSLARQVEVGLYVGYSSTRMASQMRHWGGRVISMEVDPYHAAIARNTIEWAGLTEPRMWCG